MVASSEQVKDFQGVVPQTSIIPTGNVDYFRTSWNGQSAVGKGFERETNQFRPPAIEWTAPEDFEGGERITNLKERYSITTKASEYAKELSVGAGIAVEAYGANISGSMQLDQNSENSSNAVTLNLRRSYVSEPLLFADPATNDSVQLTDPAKEFLERKGVEKFAERFGTHFIAGYTIGGLFSGTVRFIDNSESGLFALKGEVQASIPVGVAQIEGNASINLSETFSEQNVSTVTNYTAIGWNKKFDENGAILPPQVVTTIEGMVTAANEMEIDNGERLEAILIPYEDLSDYQEVLLRKDWEPADKLDIAKFQTIAKLLSQEFIALNVLIRLMDNALVEVGNIAPDNADFNDVQSVEDLRQRAFLLQQEIQASFSANSGARQNWFNLDEYISFFRFVKLTMPDASYNPDVPLVFPTLEPIVDEVPPPVPEDGDVPEEPTPVPETPELDALDAYLIYRGEDATSVELINSIEAGRRLANTVFGSDEIEAQFDEIIATNGDAFFPKP